MYGVIQTIDRTRYMSEKEVIRLRTVARNRSNNGRICDIKRWAIVDVVTSTGLRVSELLRLNIGDYFGESERPFLKVWTLKKKKAVWDIVPMSEDCCLHIIEYLEWRRKHGESIEPTDPLLTGVYGRRYVKRNLQYLFKVACRKAGLESHYSIHSARHTVGFLLLRKSKNLRLVQKQLRHSSPATTAVFYADVAFDEQLDAINGLFKKKQVKR